MRAGAGNEIGCWRAGQKNGIYVPQRMAPPDTDSLKRRRIDRYELHELIGEGGMGAVYRAFDSRLGRTVALKTVVSHRSGEGLTNELRQRFMREALAASRSITGTSSRSSTSASPKTGRPTW